MDFYFPYVELLLTSWTKKGNQSNRSEFQGNEKSVYVHVVLLLSAALCGGDRAGYKSSTLPQP